MSSIPKKARGKLRAVARRARDVIWPDRVARKEHKFHFQKLQDRFVGKRAPTPWQDIMLAADLRSDDHILDMGCAEGHITIELARHVAKAHGVEIDPVRVQEAARLASERGISNVTFAVGSASDYALDEKSYDIVLFLGVIGKKTPTGYVGLPELERLLHATRRQIFIRAGIQKQSMVNRELSLPAIMKTMDVSGFDSICFARQDASFGNIIVGSRRGAGARLAKAPPFVLIPTEQVIDHPCLQGARVASHNEFT